MDEDILIPIAFFATVVLAIYFFVKARTSERLALIEKGMDMSHLQKLPDHGFDKKVMQKIHTEAAKESKLAKTKLLAWIMIIISAFLIPLTIWVISGQFYTIQTKVFSFTFEEQNLIPFLSVIFSIFLLYLIENLAKDSR